MAAPKSPIQPTGDGYYWVQLYDADTEELEPPCVIQIYKDNHDGKTKAAWLGCDLPMKIPVQWVWLSKLEMPEALIADLNG